MILISGYWSDFNAGCTRFVVVFPNNQLPCHRRIQKQNY